MYHFFTDHQGNVRLRYNTNADCEEEKMLLLNVRPSRASGTAPFETTLRQWTSDRGRYAFQGQEHDPETGYDYFKYRMYDAETGRFNGVDPLRGKYPHNSAFAFSENRVVDGVELEGLEYTAYERSLDRRFSNPETSHVSEEERAFGTLALGFTPVAPLIDAYDLLVAIGEGDAEGMILGVIGFVPFGDFMKVPKKFEKISSQAANHDYLTNNKYGPYKRGSEVLEFTTETEEKFVRVYSSAGGNASGSWLAKPSELIGSNGKMLSPEQLKSKFGLKYLPDMIQDVNVPAGTKMRTGVAGEKTNWSAKGGGVQYELLNEIPVESFGKGTKLN